MSVILREVEHSDFHQIHSLFIEVYGKQPSYGFKKAFFEHDFLLGFCLIEDAIDGKPMVGYFGCFTYHRTIGSKTYKFYNSHTWIVKEDYRKQSLKLLMPYMRLKDGIVTNFSANGKVTQILEQLKFSKLEIVNFVLKQSFNFKAYFAQRKIKSVKLESDTATWHDHYAGLCLNLKLPNVNNEIELVLKVVNKKADWVQGINRISKSFINKPIITKNYFIYKIHYTNSPQVFLENFDIISHYLFFKEKIGGIIIPESLVGNLSSDHIKSEYKDVVYVKANQSNLPQIDYLYSEVFYLNILDK